MKFFICVIISLLIYIFIGFLISVLWAKYEAKKGEKADVDFYVILIWAWALLPLIGLCCLILYIGEKLKIFYLKFFEDKKK